MRGQCQLPIEKLKAIEEKARSQAPRGLTGHLRAQFAGAIHGQVRGQCQFGVGGLWVEVKRAMCQLPIKKLKILEEKATSLAPGGLTGRLRARFAGAIHGQVRDDIGFGVGGLWVRGQCVSYQLKS